LYLNGEIIDFCLLFIKNVEEGDFANFKHNVVKIEDVMKVKGIGKYVILLYVKRDKFYLLKQKVLHQKIKKI